MRTRSALLFALLAGCTTSSPTPDATTAQAHADDGTSTLAEIRSIRSRVRHGEGEKVRTELQKRLEESPGDKHVLFLQTVAGMPSDESWKQFKNQSTNNPSDPWPHLEMGAIYTEWKMYPQAQEELAKGEAASPGFLPARLGQAQLLAAKGEDAAAKAAFAELLKRADLPEAHAGLGLLALKAGDNETARRELGAAAKGDPGSLEVQRALAKLSLASGDNTAALAALREVAGMDPNDGDSRLALARLEQAQGDAEGATRDYNRAAELKGMDLEIANQLVALAAKQADPKAQQRALENLAKVDKANPQPLLQLASLALGRKDSAAAESAYQEALQRDPKQPEAGLGLARLYRDSGRRREAIEAYQALLAKPSPPAEAKAELAPLLAPLKLGSARIGGDVNKINNAFNADLNRFYRERLKEKPKLAGKLRIGVDVDKEGKITAVNLMEDTLKDEPLALHAYFTMKGAEFPKAARHPVFEYELKP